jgi:XapX domain-containing protein
MKPYLIALVVGMLIGSIYSLLGVRSPAPPFFALMGLLGMLLGEQAIPLARQALNGQEVVSFWRKDCAPKVTGLPPSSQEGPK